MPETIAPSTPPVPAPTPKPSTPPTTSTKTSSGFDKLDSRLVPKPKETITPPPKDDKGAPPAPPKDDKPKVEGAKALRDQLDKVTGERNQFQSKLSTLETRVAEYERKGKDTTALSEQVARMQKQLDEANHTIKSIRYEASPDYKDKFEKPFNNEIARVKSAVGRLTVVTGKDEETGEAKTRPATWEDFVRVYSLPEVEDRREARRLFGDDADYVQSFITNLKGIETRRQEAITEAREKATQQEQEQTANQAREREAAEAMWVTVNKDITEKHPEWFQAATDDSEGQAILKEGYEQVDIGFGNNNLTMQQKIIHDAHVRNRAAAFGYMVHKLNRVQGELEEAKTKLGEYESSKPGAVKRTSDGQVKTEGGVLDDKELSEAFEGA